MFKSFLLLTKKLCEYGTFFCSIQFPLFLSTSLHSSVPLNSSFSSLLFGIRFVPQYTPCWKLITRRLQVQLCTYDQAYNATYVSSLKSKQIYEFQFSNASGMIFVQKIGRYLTNIQRGGLFLCIIYQHN